MPEMFCGSVLVSRRCVALVSLQHISLIVLHQTSTHTRLGSFQICFCSDFTSDIIVCIVCDFPANRGETFGSLAVSVNRGTEMDVESLW